jgi:hypothetical protein
MRGTLEGLEVDAERMRANVSQATLSEAHRLHIEAEAPEDYVGAASAFVERAVEAYRQAYGE